MIAPSRKIPRAGVRHLQPGLAIAAVAALTLSLFTGPSGFGFGDQVAAPGLIFCEIRVPRAVIGALAGAALGLAGAALQGYLRNPLAEPSLIGVSGGAALGAVIAIQIGLASMIAFALPICALLGAAGAMALVLALAGEQGGSITLILAGVAVSSLTTALMSLALNLSHNPFALSEMVYWMMGSLADRSLTQLWLAAPLIVTGLIVRLRVGRALDALTLGEDAAASLGIDVARTRWQVVAGTALAVGGATAVTGTIGFVGLVVPHVLRPWVGHAPGRLLSASLFGGAALVLFADIMLRLLAPWIDLRIGVLTAILGAPFFVWLVIKMRSELLP
jgi:iron complex transport system permease protein